MLLLLFKNFWWAALWPYCTMQLAMEKAARQAADGFKPPPQQPQQGLSPRHPTQGQYGNRRVSWQVTRLSRRFRSHCGSS